MQLKALYPFNWKGTELAAGDTFEADPVEDAAALEYWAKFGKYGHVEQPMPLQPGGSQPAEPPPPTESEGPVMTSTDMPGHVGRRQRPAEQ
jgi:hypothetical protein